MKRFAIATLFLGLLLIKQSFAQSGAVIPQGGAGHADQASCVILKRMGPADQITSHLYSFGIRGKQFQYIEGKLPEGFPFHGRLTDHDVRNLQGRGAEVIGADIEIDGKFVGNTPSLVSLAPGDHEITVKKGGFTVWDKKVSVSGGHINVSAELAPQTK